MKIDLTLPIRGEDLERGSRHGHIGTHFDGMKKDFPLEYSVRKAVLFDVSKVWDRDIGTEDVDLSLIEEGMAILFRSGFMKEKGYGSDEYRHDHPQLSVSLLDELIIKKVSLILLDFAGVRRGSEHTPMDQYLADRGTFVVENLVHTEDIPEREALTLYTFPLAVSDLPGIPCRVIAETEKDPHSLIGRRVVVTVDRPKGSEHPKHPGLIYPVNYGYVEGVIGGDGEKQDAYILGEEEVLKSFEGVIIAVIQRDDDVEDKWVVTKEGRYYTREEIAEAVSFQEQYYHSHVFVG